MKNFMQISANVIWGAVQGRWSFQLFLFCFVLFFCFVFFFVRFCQNEWIQPSSGRSFFPNCFLSRSRIDCVFELKELK